MGRRIVRVMERMDTDRVKKVTLEVGNLSEGEVMEKVWKA